MIRQQTTNSFETLLLAAHELPRLEAPLELMNAPHEVIAANMRCIDGNLQHRIAAGGYTQCSDGVFIAEGAEPGGRGEGGEGKGGGGGGTRGGGRVRTKKTRWSRRR